MPDEVVKPEVKFFTGSVKNLPSVEKSIAEWLVGKSLADMLVSQSQVGEQITIMYNYIKSA